MTLQVTTLADGIRKFSDPTFDGFTGWPADNLATAQAWAAAVDEYVNVQNPLDLLESSIFPAILVPGAAQAAIVAWELVFFAGLEVGGLAAIAAFDTAFAAWGLFAAPGMIFAGSLGPPPVPPVTAAVAPPLPVSFTPPTIASVFLTGTGPPPLPPADAATQASSMALLIDSWMKTGTYVGPLGPPPLLWF